MRGMFTALAAASVIALSATAANATTTTTITPVSQPAGTTFQVSGDPFTGTDPVSAIIGHTGIASGAFEDIYQFTIGMFGQGVIGSGSGGITTNITFGGVGGLTDVDFTSVLVNGMAAIGHFTDLSGAACTTPGVGSCGAGETYTIAGVPITGGVLNTIDIKGTVGGSGRLGSYGGSATFLPVPEPATWAMMLLGFLGIGSVMSRRRRKNGQQLLQLA